MASVAAHPLHRALGLTDEESDRIRGLLGRDPNDFELAVFSVLWSEHCAYKHSALLLRRFPTDGDSVLQGPGENAGVVDVGGGEAVAFKVESHNHPSAVEPFQGAATGVGGILRDVVAMGARPIALLDGLRFGSAGWDFGRAVGGIGHYGNCLAGDERVIFRNSGKVREATIADLAEDRGPAAPDAEWTAAPNRPFQLLSLDPESHEPIWSDVHRIFKRSAKGLLRIRASLGRELTVTTDHPVVIWESGRLVHRPASSLAPGDRLPLIASLPSSEAAASAIDLLDGLDEPSIVQLPANWSPSNDVRTALIQLMPRADARHYWLNRRELPAWAFTAIEDLIAVPRDELRLRLEGRRSTSIPAVFPWTPATARLIGYYLSEGCCSRNGSTYKIVWTFGRSGRDAEYVRDIQTILDDLRIRHSVDVRNATVAITISSRLLGRLFIDVLECGHRAREKRIPSALIESEDLRADVLSGIFRGDGSVSFPRNGSPVRVSHSTTSATLHEQLLLLLQDLGIFPTRYERRAGATIQGREVASRKAYALEFYGHDAIVRASDWFAHPLRDRMRSAVAPTKGSAFSRPRAKPEGAVATVAIQAIDELDVEVPVYDFEVPGTHLFVTTGGIVTHNCVGVPTVGGDTFFDAAYDANPLVNAMCVGIVPSERLTLARASGPGNLIFLYGATTGRDGIGGASVLASQELSDENEDKRPTVQIGDPFTGKKLIEASLELVERRVVESLQDLGAAGLASSLAEMAGRGETGVDVHLDRVPLREADLEPVEIMTSESQERMVAVVAPHRLSEAEAICRCWELECAVVGEVTDSDELRAFFADELVGAVPASFLTQEAPRYRVRTTPRPLAEPIAHRAVPAEREELLDLLRSPNVRSRASIYERYDHLVGSRTVRRPGLDAAVLRLRPSLRGLAVSLDAAGRLAYLDPRAGGALAVFEAARNVACAGGRPLAITNCLNFGNPEKPEIAWELTEVIEGMARACEAIGIPVVSGNVSLYNETDGRAILPTPAVGCVGVVEDVRAIPRAWREGDVVLVAGSPDLALDGSEYQAQFLGGAAGRPPQLDFVAEAALIRFLWSSSALLTSAHDAAEGGLAVALAEAALAAGIGAEVEMGSDAVEWFGEGGGQAVVACRREDAARLGSIPLREIGVVGGARLLGVGLDELRAAHEGRRL